MNGLGIQVRILGILLIGTVTSFIACGGAGSPNAALTPTTSDLTLNLEYVDTNGRDTVGATVTVPGVASPSLTWSVDGVAGGNDAVGRITGTGTAVTYLAPTLPGTHTVTAALTSDAKKTASAPIRVFAPAMEVSVSPDSGSLAPSGTLSLTAAVTGSRHTAVTWSVDGVAGGNATTGLIAGTGTTVSYAAPASPGTHVVTATAVYNTAVYAAAAITVQSPAAVKVAVTPATSTVASAGTATLTASVTGSTNTAVTWAVDGVAGGNATVGTVTGTGLTAVYTAPPAAGTHSVTATSAADTTQSASAVLTVLAPVQVILTPASATLNAGSTASITAAVTNSTNQAVTWAVDAVPGGSAAVGTITGTGSTVTYTAPATAGSHTVTATSAADTSRQGSAVIAVQAPVAVALSPASLNVTSGGTASLTAAVTGSTTTTVTWAVDQVANGNATVGTITGTGNTVTYTAPAASGTHTITATSTADPTRSASSTATVSPGVQVTLNQGATSLATGAALSFTATVTGTTNTAVTWTVDAVAGGNATVGTITGTGNTVTYTAPATAGSHTVKATSAADTTKSASAALTVTSSVVVSLSPGATTVASAGTLSFTATVTGTSTTGVTWKVDNVTGGNSTVGTITGTGATVTYTAPAAAGTHTVMATSTADTSKNASSTVTVSAPVAVVANPTSLSVTAGSTASVTATVTGSTNTAVTWTVDNVAGGNSTTGTLTGTGATVTYNAPAAAGTHTIKATSAANTSVSASVAVTVGTGTVTVALNPSGTATMSTSGTRSFTATVSGSTNTAVTWTVDGVAGGSATTGTITGTGTTVTYTAPSSTGTHTVAATSAANTSVSASTVVTVQPASAISVTLSHIGPSYMVVNGATLFTATVSGTTSTAVTWSVDGVANGNSTTGIIYAPVDINTIIYKSPAGTGQHTITATSVADSSKSASTTITVAATIIQTSSIPVNANVKNSPYNATGNGVTDDTAAIQAAVNAVAGTGGAVVVPPGTYMINPLFSGSAGIRLGSNMTFIIQSGAVLQAISTSTQNYNIVICSSVHDVNITGGGTVVGNNLNNTIPTPTNVEGGDCITVTNSSNIVIEGVITRSAWNDGIYVGSRSSNVVVNNVDCSLNRRNGMSITDGQNIVVTNSAFHNNLGSVESAGGGIINGSGLDVEANAGESISTILFYKNTFNDNYYFGLAWGIGFGTAPGSTTGDVFVTENVSSRNKRGLDMENCPNSVITNNVCDNNTSFGIYVHDGATNTLVRGNTVTRTGGGGDGAGIELYNESGTTVDSNTCTGSAEYGCLVVDSVNPRITNNNFTGSGTQSIYTSNVTGAVISGNTP